VLGSVYEDVNGDGARDIWSGEMGLPNWGVNLLDASGQIIRSTTTDVDGNFVFDALVAGTYGVCVVNPGGYSQTQPSSGCYSASVSGSIEMWAPGNDFGMMLL